MSAPVLLCRPCQPAAFPPVQLLILVPILLKIILSIAIVVIVIITVIEFTHNIHPFTILRRLVRRAFEFLPDLFVSIFIGFDIQPLRIKPCSVEFFCSVYLPYDLYSIETL